MRSLPIVILAGGLGTRMRPITEKIPKALIEANGEAFISHQLRLLRRHNFTKVVLCIGYLGTMLEDYVGDGSRFDLKVYYSYDGEKLLGTAGALRKALPLIDSESFFVLYGDAYLPCDYQKVAESYHNQQAISLMTIYRNEGRWDTSNVEYKDQKILCYNKKHPTVKMQYIDYGLSVLSSRALSMSNTDCLSDLYTMLVDQGRMAAHEVYERFYEVGSTNGLAEFSRYLQGLKGA